MQLPDRSPRLCTPNEKCNCTEPCKGYGSRVDCPPLIVIAAMVVANVAAIAQVCATRGGR